MRRMGTARAVSEREPGAKREVTERRPRRKRGDYLAKQNFNAIIGAYVRYSQDGEKKALNARIIENNRWYKQQYTEFTSSEDAKKRGRQPMARSGYIFSAIAGKHADAMDNYPDINVLPREQADVETAAQLTDILPCVLELCDFKRTYSQNWWYKLKNGTACYGVFWNSALNGGLGDIEIKKIDLLNLSWQPGVSDLQDSKYVFYSYYMDRDAFAKKYGKEKLPLSDDISSVDSYGGVSQELLEHSVLMVDGYYKTGGAVHLVKFTGNTVLEYTEGRAGYENGLYEHGKYPFVLDVMYPNEDSPAGFGVIDVVKNPQAYIDKLDALIAENSLIVGKTRYFIRDNGGVNEDEFADLDNPFVHVEGSLDERNIQQIQGKALPSQIADIREAKINELKEVIGNRDFQQGGTSGGVTAASAITVLQQAGDKLSRDLIGESYLAYKRIVELCIELIRQFYDVERSFRILGDGGQQQFVKFDNRGLQQQPMGSVMESGMLIQPQAIGNEPVGNMLQNEMTAPEQNPVMQYLRKPEFDVSLSVQKSNPFTKEQQNQTILQLWGAGFFNPQAIELSTIALELMQFEGKDELVEKLKGFGQMQAQLQQLQAQNQQLQQQVQAAQRQVQPQMAGSGQLVEIPLR